MNTANDIDDCKWREPGGLAAARIICAFLETVDIPVSIGPIVGKTFVPGLAIVKGSVRIDPESEAFPGDLLHEAGHIAICAPELRSQLCNVGPDPGEEMAAIAWSVAAAHHCEVPLSVLFHPEGYKGGSESLIENFSAGRTFGVPLLAWWGLTTEKGNAGDQPAFPMMSRWLR